VKLIDRYRGCMVGLAVGDAVGTTLEFKQPGTFLPIDDMVGGGKFHLKAGEWTDDTAMTLCQAESLVECHGFDAADLMMRFARWFRQGYMTTHGECVSIGNTVRQAIEWYERNGDPYAGPTNDLNSGTGSLMRIAPLALYYRETPAEAIAHAIDASRTTHGSRACIDACRYFTGLLIGALEGRPRDELLSPRFCPVPGLWQQAPLEERVDRVAAGSYKDKAPPAIRGDGFVVHALEAVLWAFSHANDFRHGLLQVVNLGEDADTTGCIYGALAGAYFGIDSIPERWRAKLAKRIVIEKFATALCEVQPAA
jgi:ADP-ribosyl-[dinitrogen reductase] hydrolase